MVPNKNMSVKLTDRFLAFNPNLLHLKDVKLSIKKVDLLVIRPGAMATYEVSFTDGSYISQLIIDQKGQVNGVDVFESWVAMAGVAQVDGFVISGNSIRPAVKENEPKNNDGRTNCFWCNLSTEKRGGGQYDVCPKCGK